MNRRNRTGIIVLTILAILCAVLVWMLVEPALAEEEETEVWILMKPGDYVNVRMYPRKKSEAIGRLDAGDSFLTDGKTKNGFLHVLNVGECDGWVYKWYVAREQPEIVNEYYTVVAKRQLICRRGVGGPRIKGRLGWMKNGTRVKVFCIAGEWAITSRGYVKSEWLEVDPS